MAIAFRASGSALASSGGASAVTVTKPAGATAGDVAVAIISLNSSTAVTDNNGAAAWTKVAEHNEAAHSMCVWRRVLDGAEGASYDFTADASVSWGIVTAEYSGVDTTTPIDVAPSFQSDAATTTGTAPSVTTVTDGALALAACSADTGAGAFTDYPDDVGEDYTLRVETTASRDLALVEKLITAAGVIAAQTFTYDTSTGLRGVHFALRPAVAAAGGQGNQNLLLLGVG